MALSEKEWKQRVLCSDGNCIGIVGANGRCKVCGLAYDGQLPSILDEDVSDEDDLEEDGLEEVWADSPGTESDGGQTDPPPLETDKMGGDWDNRTLCIDESCIGVVGSDGACKECGKPHPGKKS